MLDIKKLLTKMLTVSETTNAIQLRDGSTTGTVLATGTQTNYDYGRLHMMMLDISIPSITVSNYGVITGITGVSMVRIPAILNIKGGNYATVALQLGSSAVGAIIRGEMNGSMSNPTFTTDATGRFTASYVWIL